jgi:hypothetical protein
MTASDGNVDIVLVIDIVVRQRGCDNPPGIGIHANV